MRLCYSNNNWIWPIMCKSNCEHSYLRWKTSWENLSIVTSWIVRAKKWWVERSSNWNSSCSKRTNSSSSNRCSTLKMLLRLDSVRSCRRQCFKCKNQKGTHSVTKFPPTAGNPLCRTYRHKLLLKEIRTWRDQRDSRTSAMETSNKARHTSWEATMSALYFSGTTSLQEWSRLKRDCLKLRTRRTMSLNSLLEMQMRNLVLRSLRGNKDPKKLAFLFLKSNQIEHSLQENSLLLFKNKIIYLFVKIPSHNKSYQERMIPNLINNSKTRINRKVQQ